MSRETKIVIREIEIHTEDIEHEVRQFKIVKITNPRSSDHALDIGTVMDDRELKQYINRNSFYCTIEILGQE